MIAAIVERLKAGAVFTDVLIAEDLDALGKGTAARHGTVFVLPYRERAEPNGLIGGFRQHVDVQFLTAILIRQHNDVSGSARVSAFDDLKEAVEAALAGWSFQPVNHPGSIPCELVAAQAAPLGNGVTAYVQTWQTDRYLEAKP